MPGTVTLSLPTQHHDADADDNAGDLEIPEKIPLILPLKVEPTWHNAICLHQVTKYEQQLHLAQLQDLLTELQHVCQIRHTLLTNHQTQISGQGQCISTRSCTVIGGVEEYISKSIQHYCIAYDALIELDLIGEWREAYLKLKDKDNWGPVKEDNEQGPGDGSYTLSWIWLSNPWAHDTTGNDARYSEGTASEEDVNKVMWVQWATL